MATKKKESYTGQSADALSKALSEKQAALSAFRFGTSKSKAKNVREGRTLRRDIARILTAMKVGATK